MSRPKATGDDRSHLFSGYPGRVLLSLSFIWLTLVTGRLLLPPLLPVIIDDLGITLAAAGVMLTVLQGAAALLLYPSGRLSDQLGRSTVIGPALVILTVGTLLIGSAPVYLVLVVGATTYGFGNGLYNIAARTLISDHFVERRGQALGVYAAGFSLGAILASGIAILTGTLWRRPFFLIAGLFVVGTLLFVVLNREQYALESVELDLRATTRRLLSARELREPILAFCLFGIATQSFTGFFPAYLQDVKDLSPTLATVGFALVFAVGVVSKVGAGALSDRYPRRYIATGGMALAGVSLLGIMLADSIPYIFAAIVLFAIGHQAQFPLIDAILLDAAPETDAGGDLGAARTVYLLVGSIGPAYVGYVAQTYDFTVAFGGLVVLLSISAAILLVGRRKSSSRASPN